MEWLIRKEGPILARRAQPAERIEISWRVRLEVNGRAVAKNASKIGSPLMPAWVRGVSASIDTAGRREILRLATECAAVIEGRHLSFPER